MNIQAFFDKDTSTLSYIVWDSATRDGVVIDPVWDYDQAASEFKDGSIRKITDFVDKNKINLHLILETHAHADHVSSSQALKSRYPHAKIAIGKDIRTVQKTFQRIYNLPSHFRTDGSQFDTLLEDGQVLQVGSLSIRVISTPGHTPTCLSFLIQDALFTGDAIFMPDYGTGRCDFPDGSAKTLYHSITQRIYTLPDNTRIFVGHDYQPGGRPLAYETTVAEQKKTNVHLNSQTSEAQFVEFRTQRDKTLSAPRLLFPSIQINIAAGKLPSPEDNGKSYLKIPLAVTRDISANST